MIDPVSNQALSQETAPSFYKETNFKDSPIGKIPQDWDVATFGESFTYKKGKKPSVVSSEYSKGFLPYLSTQYLRENGIHNFASISNGVITVNEGDIILLWDGSNAGEFFLGKKGVLSSTMVKIDLNHESYNPKFLYYLLKTKEQYIKSQTKGTGIPHVDGNVLDRLVIPSPKHAEQEKIVGVLGVVDCAIELADRIIAKTERLKRELMQQLLTRGINILSTYNDEVIYAALNARAHLPTNEWNLSHHLAVSLEKVFRKYDVDVELIKDPTNERPDIVIHERGTNDQNLLAIELKIQPTVEDASDDIEKLERLMLSHYGYRSALFVGYNVRADPQDIMRISTKVNFILIRPDGTFEKYFAPDKIEYKQTPIGTIPKEWTVVKLGDVSIDFIGGGTPSTAIPEYWNGDIAWMTSAHINGKQITHGQKYITKKGLENSATHLIPKGNLLVATRVGIGKVAVNTIDIAISQDLTGVIINREKALPEFLYWVLINNGNRLKALAQGSTIKGLLKEDLGKFQIPLPPLEEQQRIDEILSTADKKLELERGEKVRLERIKAGLMDLLLTGKVRIKVD